MRPWATWGIGAALVAAAWGVAVITPAEDAEEAPFAVAVEVGEPGVGRTIAITVSDVRRAENVSAGEWSAEGNWFVVDLDAEAVATEFGTLLALATLEVDGRTFRASERPDSLLRSPLSVGIPVSGSLAFELPDGLTAGSGVLRFGASTDVRLDSVITVAVDLADAPVAREAELRADRLGRPMTRGWWRRNAVSLAAIAVLLPVTVGVIAVKEWSEWDLGHATKPITVEVGDTVTYAGARIGPAKAEFVDDALAPAGTRVISTTVLVTPGATPIACRTPQLRETGGAGRQWDEASFELERDFDTERNTFCDSETPIRYSLTLDYLVPDDATGPFAIEIESGDELPEFVRLVVAP